MILYPVADKQYNVGAWSWG